MKVYMIGATLHGFNHSVGCPLCGYVTHDKDKFPAHFQTYHSLPGEEWKIHEFVHPTNSMHKLYVITPDQI